MGEVILGRVWKLHRFTIIWCLFEVRRGKQHIDVKRLTDIARVQVDEQNPVMRSVAGLVQLALRPSTMYRPTNPVSSGTKRKIM
jgi:hypothetical protein